MFEKSRHFQPRRFYPYLFLGLIITWNSLFADIDNKTRKVYLQTQENDTLVVGSITFNKRGESFQYALNLNDEVFNEHFLSMRPFKCLDGPKQLVCHLPYPYENKKTISKDNLIDLEYDLLFLHKTENEYGIDPWNGLYYRLQWKENGIMGDLHEVDLNILAAPPEAGNLRPIHESDLHTSDASKHSYPRLIIE